MKEKWVGEIQKLEVPDYSTDPAYNGGYRGALEDVIKILSK